MAYETARAGGKLSAARAAVEAWSRLVDPQSPEIQAAWSELTPILRRAEALAAKARKLERTDPPAARNLYLQALDIAADLPDALAGLARTPPDPPIAMDAQVLGDRIRLIWTPPPPDGLGPLTFVVVRKRNGVLQHPADGTRIAEVGTCEFDDTLLTPGETVGYAVLSRRGGVDSVGAISLGPFVFLADVKDVRRRGPRARGRVDLVAPRGIAEVRVIRKRGGPPANPKDGDRIASASDHAIDRDIDPDQDYYYGIYAIYRMPDGRLFPSPGIVVAARPQPTVAVPEAPRLLQEPTGRVRIDWIEPARGSVRILRTPHPLPLPAGSRLDAAEAEVARRTMDRAGRSRSGLRPRSASQRPLVLHPDGRLGRHVDRRARLGPQPGAGPVRAARDPRRQRAGLDPRRHPRHAPMAMEPGSDGRAGRRPAGCAAAGAERSARDHGERPPRGLRPAGLLDVQLTDDPTPRHRSTPARGSNGLRRRGGPIRRRPVVHPGLQRRRVGRRPHALAGPGAVGGHDPARPAPGSHRLL